MSPPGIRLHSRKHTLARCSNRRETIPRHRIQPRIPPFPISTQQRLRSLPQSPLRRRRHLHIRNSTQKQHAGRTLRRLHRTPTPRQPSTPVQRARAPSNIHRALHPTQTTHPRTTIRHSPANINSCRNRSRNNRLAQSSGSRHRRRHRHCTDSHGYHHMAQSHEGTQIETSHLHHTMARAHPPHPPLLLKTPLKNQQTEKIHLGLISPIL